MHTLNNINFLDLKGTLMKKITFVLISTLFFTFASHAYTDSYDSPDIKDFKRSDSRLFRDGKTHSSFLISFRQRTDFNLSDYSLIAAKIDKITTVVAETKIPDMWKGNFDYLMMHDSFNSILPKYRTYSDFSFNLTNHPQVEEIAGLSAVIAAQKYWARQIERLKLYQSVEQHSKVQAAALGLFNLVDAYKAKFDRTIVSIAENVAESIAQRYFEVYRYDDLGKVKSYNYNQAPGQFRLDPTTDQDKNPNFVGWVDAPVFTICSPSSTRQGLFSVAYPMDDIFLKEYEEVRCLARKMDENNTPVLGPNCKRTISLDEFQRVSIGLTSTKSDDGLSVREKIVKIRNYGFADRIRMAAFADIVYLDTHIQATSIRYRVNHWRPYHAIRSGLPQFPEMTYEKDWRTMEDYFNNFPEYPSGSQSVSSASAQLIRFLLNEFNSTDKIVDDLTQIDGIPTRFIRKGSFVFAAQSYNFEEVIDSMQKSQDYWSDVRVLMGPHFRTSADHAQILGRQVVTQLWSNGFLARVGGLNDSGQSYLKADGSFRNCK
jgi:hypothetical protein